ncbi:PHP domain-containing protein [Nocardioidaceae bacterium]|nr:PHP domain-containing protein [Nocardioidaceae bacterium]
MRIDLHTHSNISDGSDDPAELVRKAAATGLDVVALTDHDTVDGWDEALEAGQRHGITVVTGIEFSVTDLGSGRHLLGYLVDPRHERIAEILGRAASSRADRIDALFPRLSELGLSVDEQRVRASGEGIPSRKHVAKAMVEAGHVADEDEAFAEWLNEGKPAYVERYRPDIVDAIAAIREAGGVSVIAHPRDTRRGPGVDDERLAELAGAGLDGVEVDHQAHSPDVRGALRDVTDRLGLVVTGSSDYHGTRKTDHDLGCNLTAPDQGRALLGDLIPLTNG